MKDFAADLSAKMPDLIETEFELWQLRVDRAKQGAQTPHIPIATLSVVQALEYARTTTPTGGRSEPTGKALSFLVSHKSNHEAAQKVKAQLTAHGLPADNYMIRLTFSNITTI
jgi:hypothetical protein